MNAATALSSTRSGSARSGLSAPWILLPCMQYHRALSTSAARASGHNRWSKIRHEKGAADARKNQMRSTFSKSITLLSRLYGADLLSNPQLAASVAAAKKAGVPKNTIEAAVARGQGVSADGARLENAMFEIMMAPSVAVLIEVETDSKGRVTQEINQLVRRKGGNATATKFLFARRGRVVLGAAETEGDVDDKAAKSNSTPAPPLVTADDVLDDAIEAGAEDVEMDEDDGSIVIWTPPNHTGTVVNQVAPKFKLAVLSAETIWTPNEDTLAPIGKGDEIRHLAEFITALRGSPDVRMIYSNATQGNASDEDWQQIAQELDW